MRREESEVVNLGRVALITFQTTHRNDELLSTSKVACPVQLHSVIHFMSDASKIGRMIVCRYLERPIHNEADI